MPLRQPRRQTQTPETFGHHEWNSSAQLRSKEWQARVAQLPLPGTNCLRIYRIHTLTRSSPAYVGQEVGTNIAVCLRLRARRFPQPE
jgi:hypothetical protein